MRWAHSPDALPPFQEECADFFSAECQDRTRQFEEICDVNALPACERSRFRKLMVESLLLMAREELTCRHLPVPPCASLESPASSRVAGLRYGRAAKALLRVENFQTGPSAFAVVISGDPFGQVFRCDGGFAKRDA
jgi:hypothetical protein